MSLRQRWFVGGSPYNPRSPVFWLGVFLAASLLLGWTIVTLRVYLIFAP